jgi:hypothetical protein
MAVALLAAGTARAAGAEDTVLLGADVVDALAAAETGGKPPPRMKDPAWTARFTAGLDPTVVATLDPGDIGGQVKVCESGNQVGQAYMQFGVKSASLVNPSPEAIRGLNANIKTYQDEVALSARFVVVCFSKVLTSTTQFVGALRPEDWTPERKQGIGMVRSGTVTIYQGVVQNAMGADGMTPANRNLILTAAAEHADVYAQAIRPSDRLRVRNLVDVALNKMNLPPDVKAKLQKIGAAMARKDCAGLCAI